MFEERFESIRKPCPKCGQEINFIEDLPKVWYGHCRICEVVYVVENSLAKKPKICIAFRPAGMIGL